MNPASAQATADGVAVGLARTHAGGVKGTSPRTKRRSWFSGPRHRNVPGSSCVQSDPKALANMQNGGNTVVRSDPSPFTVQPPRDYGNHPVSADSQREFGGTGNPAHLGNGPGVPGGNSGGTAPCRMPEAEQADPHVGTSAPGTASATSRTPPANSADSTAGLPARRDGKRPHAEPSHERLID